MTRYRHRETGEIVEIFDRVQIYVRVEGTLMYEDSISAYDLLAHYELGEEPVKEDDVKGDNHD